MRKLQKAIKNKQASVEAYAWCPCSTCRCTNGVYSMSDEDFINKGVTSNLNTSARVHFSIAFEIMSWQQNG